jgi:hypothetical protein
MIVYSSQVQTLKQKGIGIVLTSYRGLSWYHLGKERGKKQSTIGDGANQSYSTSNLRKTVLMVNY